MKNLIIILIIFIFSNVFSYGIKTSELNEYINNLTLREKIGQIFFLYVPDDNDFKTVPGGIIPSKKILKELYYNDNYYNKTFSKYKIPVFIGIDGEGGKVNRFNFINDFPSMNELSHLNKREIDSIINYEILLMKKCNVNVNFSPVIDLSDMSAALMKRTNRNIAENVDSIILFAESYIKTFKKNRIFCTLKHYPGYGNTFYNSDVDIYKFNGDYKDFLNGFVLFSVLLKNVDFVMISNLVYPVLDSLPALMSETIIKYIDYYNKRIVKISDDIASKAQENPFETLRKSFNAGTDMCVLMNSEIYEEIIDSMEYWILNNELSEKELNKKVKKIILKKEYLFRIISKK